MMTVMALLEVQQAILPRVLVPRWLQEALRTWQADGEEVRRVAHCIVATSLGSCFGAQVSSLLATALADRRAARQADLAAARTSPPRAPRRRIHLAGRWRRWRRWRLRGATTAVATCRKLERQVQSKSVIFFRSVSLHPSSSQRTDTVVDTTYTGLIISA